MVRTAKPKVNKAIVNYRRNQTRWTIEGQEGSEDIQHPVNYILNKAVTPYNDPERKGHEDDGIKIKYSIHVNGDYWTASTLAGALNRLKIELADSVS